MAARITIINHFKRPTKISIGAGDVERLTFRQFDSLFGGDRNICGVSLNERVLDLECPSELALAYQLGT